MPPTKARASLLGLPPELRLQIYSYLLCDSSITTWTHDKHYCIYPTGRNEHDRRPKCTCSKQPNWQILSASRFIRVEAWSLFKQATEFRVFLPSMRPEHRETGPPLHSLHQMIQDNIRSLVLVGSQSHLVVSGFPGEPPQHGQRDFCRRLISIVPKLKNLRIHLEIREYGHLHVNTFDFEAFESLATFAYLQSICIQADDCTKLTTSRRQPSWQPSWQPQAPRLELNLFRLKLRAALEKGAASVGNTIKIVDASRDRRQ